MVSRVLMGLAGQHREQPRGTHRRHDFVAAHLRHQERGAVGRVAARLLHHDAGGDFDPEAGEQLGQVGQRGAARSLQREHGAAAAAQPAIQPPQLGAGQILLRLQNQQHVGIRRNLVARHQVQTLHLVVLVFQQVADAETGEAELEQRPLAVAFQHVDGGQITGGDVQQRRGQLLLQGEGVGLPGLHVDVEYVELADQAEAVATVDDQAAGPHLPLLLILAGQSGVALRVEGGQLDVLTAPRVPLQHRVDQLILAAGGGDLVDRDVGGQVVQHPEGLVRQGEQPILGQVHLQRELVDEQIDQHQGGHHPEGGQQGVAAVAHLLALAQAAHLGAQEAVAHVAHVRSTWCARSRARSEIPARPRRRGSRRSGSAPGPRP